MDVNRSFSESGTQEIPDQWWLAFADEQLNLMIESALDSNFNLEVAWQRIKVARAIVDRESSFLLPDLEGSVQGEVSQPQRAFENFQQNRSLQVGLSSAYELDLWGRIRANVQAEKFRAEASQLDYQAASISLSAEIALTWYQVIEANNQLQLIDKQIATNQQVLDLIENRFGTGQVRSVDFLRQKQLIESTREQRTYVASRLETQKHRLAVLLGRSPIPAIEFAVDSLPKLPAMPETGDPMQLIHRRPDVQSAYNVLAAADKELAAAIVNQYPRVSFSLSASTAANDTDLLFRDWAYSLGANLLAPVFYGGELRAEVDRSEAFKKQRLFEYGQTILIAFQEVEDALIQEENQKESIQLIDSQIEIARQTYEQLRIEYFNGISNYLDVLTALDTLQQLRRDALSARLILLQYRIALYRALAGRISTPREVGS
ncbi:MAG: efflux transporter outer membrane subunit [Candidatus Lokiarchaeota archaeon]|nr:efflux transporter outer membrane subunit [Candidatus Lokiarchaeota archaeon]